MPKTLKPPKPQKLVSNPTSKLFSKNKHPHAIHLIMENKKIISIIILKGHLDEVADVVDVAPEDRRRLHPPLQARNPSFLGQQSDVTTHKKCVVLGGG